MGTTPAEEEATSVQPRAINVVCRAKLFRCITLTMQACRIKRQHRNESIYAVKTKPRALEYFLRRPPIRVELHSAREGLIMGP